ncbi:MAG: PAS domain S-box protein, partial [Deltaproteobacteria bacterium]|nr:PAS domain S-box protein [Deltaproteobacteria bacterium]
MKEDGLEKNKHTDGKDSSSCDIKDPGRQGKNGTASGRAISGDRYNAFIEEINDGVYETDIHGNFSYFNNSFCEIFGYPREEIQGNNFSKFMDKANARKAYKAFTKIWVTHIGFSDLIWEIIDKKGKVRIIELSAHLFTNPKGKKTGFRGIARDVTLNYRAMEDLKESELRYQKEYKASRRAERLSRNLLDFVPYPMVAFALDGKVTYLNPAFTRVFGWTLDELRGKHIPYIPSHLKQEAKEGFERLFQEKIVRLETRRLTKDGRLLDVIMRGTVYSKDRNDLIGEVFILRDITEEKRMRRTNETLLRISMALPAHPDLEDLLDYISDEIKRLLNTEGALIPLLDEEKDEIFFQGAAYDDSTAQKRVKMVRFPVDKSMTGKVIKTGEPVIVLDTSKYPEFYPGVDEQTHVQTKNMLIVPLRSSDRIIGVINAVNKKEGVFDNTDLELLSMIAGTVALSIENARFAGEIKEAYQEVSSLNRAKDKVINHLSHELKTPVSVLLASLNILEEKMKELPEDSWSPTLVRARRNLERILEIQYQVGDIMRDKEYRSYQLLSGLLDQCTDELEVLVVEEIGEGPIIQKIRDRIEESFGPKETKISEIDPGMYVQERLKELNPQFSHRKIDIIENMENAPPVFIPQEVL